MYVCGVTPYAPSHIGHGRCYVSFDIVYRFLKFLGYEVLYCRNYTDIDDKLLNKAQDKLRYQEIAHKYITSFQDDMRALDCATPDFEPRVTENISAIIEFIEGLIAKGHAYEARGDVYFSVRSFPHYAELSKHKLDDLRVGARVDAVTMTSSRAVWAWACPAVTAAARLTTVAIFRAINEGVTSVRRFIRCPYHRYL